MKVAYESRIFIWREEAANFCNSNVAVSSLISYNLGANKLILG